MQTFDVSSQESEAEGFQEFKASRVCIATSRLAGPTLWKNNNNKKVPFQFFLLIHDFYIAQAGPELLPTPEITDMSYHLGFIQS